MEKSEQEIQGSDDLSTSLFVVKPKLTVALLVQNFL